MRKGKNIRKDYNGVTQAEQKNKRKETSKRGKENSKINAEWIEGTKSMNVKNGDD